MKTLVIQRKPFNVALEIFHSLSFFGEKTGQKNTKPYAELLRPLSILGKIRNVHYLERFFVLCILT